MTHHLNYELSEQFLNCFCVCIANLMLYLIQHRSYFVTNAQRGERCFIKQTLMRS